jgi:hydrogenase maturation protease
MSAEKPRTLVIGVGNDYRSDDAAGLLVARRLKELSLGTIVIREQSGEGTSLLETLKSADRVILIDAVSSGSQPGEIFRFEADREPIPTRFFHYSTHAFSVAEAIELGRELGQLPSLFIVYGIEGKRFEAGTEISPEVEKAIGKVVKKILQEI